METPTLVAGATLCRSKNFNYPVFSLRVSDQAELIREMRGLAHNAEHVVLEHLPGHETTEIGFAFPIGGLAAIEDSGAASDSLQEQIIGWSFAKKLDPLPPGFDVPDDWMQRPRDFLPHFDGARFDIINIVSKEHAVAFRKKEGIFFSPASAADWKYWSLLSFA